MSQFPSFRRRPESSQTKNPRSGLSYFVVPLRVHCFNLLDSGLRRNDGFYRNGVE